MTNRQVMTQDELEAVIKWHEAYFTDGLDLNTTDLSHFNLRNYNLAYANLNGADLSYAQLEHANLSNADLQHAHLYGANLCWANLTGADLSTARLRYAHLFDAELDGVNMNWDSRELIGERLRQAADNDLMKLGLAGAIACNPDFCWEDWLEMTDNEVWGETGQWAIALMKTWVRKNDHHPRCLDDNTIPVTYTHVWDEDDGVAYLSPDTIAKLRDCKLFEEDEE